MPGTRKNGAKKERRRKTQCGAPTRAKPLFEPCCARDHDRARRHSSREQRVLRRDERNKKSQRGLASWIFLVFSFVPRACPSSSPFRSFRQEQTMGQSLSRLLNSRAMPDWAKLAAMGSAAHTIGTPHPRRFPRTICHSQRFTHFRFRIPAGYWLPNLMLYIIWKNRWFMQYVIHLKKKPNSNFYTFVQPHIKKEINEQTPTNHRPCLLVYI